MRIKVQRLQSQYVIQSGCYNPSICTQSHQLCLRIGLGTLRIATRNISPRRTSVFSQLQNLNRETRENSVSLKWHGRAMRHGQTVPIRCPLKSSSFFDPAPTGDHATQQHARASARATPVAQILGHKPNNLHLGPKSPTSQNAQQLNPMQSRHQNPFTPRGMPRRAISTNQHLPSSSKAQTWLQEGVW